MPAFKRSRYFCVSLTDRKLLDLESFLAGELRFSVETQWVANSAVTESETTLSSEELRWLALVPADRWIALDALAEGEQALEPCSELARRGLLLSDSDEAPFPALREREERLMAAQWHPGAACYHFKAKQPGAIGITDAEAILDLESIAAHSAEGFAHFVEKNGPPPVAFHRRSEVEDSSSTIDLPLVSGKGELFAAMAGRRTVRSFDAERPMRGEDLATLLYYTFGCHGFARLSDNVVTIKRTSPSGGCMHPIEVYPLVLNVAGVVSGLYHYDSFGHRLRRLELLSSIDLSRLAIGILGGQSFAGTAHALLIMTARFERNFWKYRNNVKTYGIVLMDAAHLSQTGYLMCSHLGLGAFFSAAINVPMLEELLQLDGIREGAIGAFGCGTPLENADDLGLSFQPFVPRTTVV